MRQRKLRLLAHRLRRMDIRGTRARVYGALLAGGIVLALASGLAYGLGAPWADAWMPNFIAEWGGIVIAVVFVDRLLARAHSEERRREEWPLRRAAAERVVEVFEPFLEYVAATGARSLFRDGQRALPVRELWRWPGVQTLDELPANAQHALRLAARSVAHRLHVWERQFSDVLSPAGRSLVPDIHRDLEVASAYYPPNDPRAFGIATWLVQEVIQYAAFLFRDFGIEETLLDWRLEYLFAAADAGDLKIAAPAAEAREP